MDVLVDTFKGDDAKLVGCIEALLKLDRDGALVPNGLGGPNSHAWGMLAAAACRLRASAPEACTLPPYHGALYQSAPLNEIANERHRQIVAEGWSSEHDDEHTLGELATAAVCYSGASGRFWPWDWKWWKPKSRRENLIKAGALIVAEIERLDRKSASAFLIDNIDSAGMRGARKEAMANHASMLTGWRPTPAAPPARSAAMTDEPESFQARVDPWLMECFGLEIARDILERNHRFLEEALELVQANGCTAHEAHQLVDYVYGREGEINQEVGGVMVTLAALCLASGVDMHEAAETELARVWTKVEKIRSKHFAKPKFSPLPGASEPSHTTATSAEPVAVYNAIHALELAHSHMPNGAVRDTVFKASLALRSGSSYPATPPSSGNADAVREKIAKALWERFHTTLDIMNGHDFSKYLTFADEIAALSSAPVAGDETPAYQACRAVWEDIETCATEAEMDDWKSKELSDETIEALTKVLQPEWDRRKSQALSRKDDQTGGTRS